ncbi:class I SAM-dependent methyltransferase [Herbaspirillum sp. HC18]|nr:class I SAM-dependent methyltransferase [Herbaspirillum sp. HC18]
MRAIANGMAGAAYSHLRALAAYPRYLAAEIKEGIGTIARYYSNASFRRADLYCMLAYLGQNPDAICREFLRCFPDDKVQKIYGETFFSTLETIGKAVGVSERDVIYDLGCGRGRAVFWFNAMYKCRAIGVEINPAFVIQARMIAKKASMANAEFILANMLDIDYDDATVIYLYGTAFADDAVERLVSRFASLRPGTRIISVSYPLTWYADASLFELEQTIRGRYVWGETNIYVHRKT